MNESDKNSLITVKNLSMEFTSGETTIKVLNNATFTIPEGSFTIIHGHSGSGKTTLLNSLTGLNKPTSGSVNYKNKDIYNLTPIELAHFRAKTMGIVYQANHWVKSLSVIENVALPLYFLGYDKKEAEKTALDSLKRIGMERHKDKLPSLLSGGEQQRISMARALVSNPKYIVADEPTGNLDSKNGKAIMDLLKACNEQLNRTVILITHNLEYLSYGTHTIHVLDGEVTKKTEHRATHKATDRGTSVSSIIPQKLHEDSIETTSFGPLKTKILMLIALKNLRFNRFRSSLTIMGVVIGIGSVFLLLSFGLGLQDLVKNQIIGAASTEVVDVRTPNTKAIKMDNDAVTKFQNVAHVNEVGRLNTSAGELEFDGAGSDTVVYGVNDSYLKLSDLDTIAGIELNSNNKNEIMVNKSLLTALSYKDFSQALGKEMMLSLKLDTGDKAINHPFTVVGVVGSGKGPNVYVDQSIYQAAGIENYQQIKLSVDDQDNIAKVRQQLESFGYDTTSPLDTLEQVNSFFNIFNIILVSFGGIGMFIAIIGMLNTLTISLLERTKEIGLMVALGGRKNDMRRLFVAEALLFSSMGGILGIIGAILIGLGVDIVLNHMATSRGVVDSFSLFSSPIWLIAATVAFMLVVGLIVSYIPAKRAANINPIDALRRD